MQAAKKTLKWPSVTQYERKTPLWSPGAMARSRPEQGEILLWSFVITMSLQITTCKCPKIWIIYLFHSVDSWLQTYCLCMCLCLPVFVPPRQWLQCRRSCKLWEAEDDRQGDQARSAHDLSQHGSCPHVQTEVSCSQRSFWSQFQIWVIKGHFNSLVMRLKPLCVDLHVFVYLNYFCGLFFVAKTENLCVALSLFIISVPLHIRALISTIAKVSHPETHTKT